MPQVCCCRSSNSGEYNVQPVLQTDSSQQKRYKFCGCSIEADDHAQVATGSVLMGIGMTFCVCYLIHNFTSDKVAEIMWFFTAIGGGFIFSLGLFILTCIPMMKFMASSVERLTQQRYSVNSPSSSPPPPGRPRVPAQPTSPTSISNSMLFLPFGGANDDFRNEAFQQGHVSNMLPPHYVDNPSPEQIAYEERYVVAEQIANQQQQQRNRPFQAQEEQDSSAQDELSIAMRNLTTESIGRRIFVRRSLSLNTGLADCVQRAMNNTTTGVTTAGPPVRSRLVSTRQIVYEPPTPAAAYPSRATAITCSRTPNNLLLQSKRSNSLIGDDESTV